MPQIIVAADRGAAFREGAVTFRETVNVADFESQHFATQLVERIGWAVEDADQVEQVSTSPDEPAEVGQVSASPDAELRPQRIPGASRSRRITESTEPRREERVIAQSPA